MIILGCDPGTDPALVAFDVHRHTLTVLPTVSQITTVWGKRRTRPVAELIRGAIDQVNPDAFVMEYVHAHPKQGIASTAAFLRSAGLLQGVAVGAWVPCYVISTKDWREAAEVTGDKCQARARAAELWPDQADLFRRKKDHNVAEAALIAYAGNLKFSLDAVSPQVHRQNVSLTNTQNTEAISQCIAGLIRTTVFAEA